MVEHRLAKAGVGGSNPLSRSKISSPSPSVSCASSFPRHDGAGGRPPSRPTCPPHQPKPPSLAPSSASPLPAVILVASTGIQSCRVRVFLPPSRWRWGETPLATHLPPHLRPLPSPPSFSWPPRESSPRPHSGFPPSARITGERQRQEQDWIPTFGENDGGEGKGHSRRRACFSFAVILFPSFSWPPRESSPVMCAFPPPVTMALGGDPPRDPLTPRQPSPLARSLIGLSPPRRHSRGLHGNPVLDRILGPRLQRE